MIPSDNPSPVIRREWYAPISELVDCSTAMRPILTDRYGEWFVESYEIPPMTGGGLTCARAKLRLAIPPGGLSADTRALFAVA